MFRCGMDFASDQGKRPKAYSKGTVSAADTELAQKTPTDVHGLDAFSYYGKYDKVTGPLLSFQQ